MRIERPSSLQISRGTIHVRPELMETSIRSHSPAYNMDPVGFQEEEDLSLARLFGWPEYLVFGGMMALSVAIGVYYGCTGKNQTTKDFLMGGKNMGVFPVACSIIASFISAITLLGQPSEVYTYGTMFWMSGVSYPFVLLAAAYLYLPVFYDLEVVSAYQYLELRFSRPVRLIVSAISMLHVCNYMAIVVYAPSLALSQVTGMDLYGCVVTIFVICTFYTSIGGLKAVVWTDTLQLVIMMIATTFIIFKGAFDVGGPSEVWRLAGEGGRLEFLNASFDPRTRHTVWGLFLGCFFMWLGYFGCSQAQVQRYLSVPTKRKARQALFISYFGLFALLTLSCYAGLVIYAKYSACDPLTSKKMRKPDQIFPLFVMETVGNFPGLPGLFVAGIFSGTLSTISTGLNSLSTMALEDFVKGGDNRQLSEQKATRLSKFFAVFFALVAFGLVFVAEKLGQIQVASISVGGTTYGPVLGLFTLGMVFPWVNSKGAVGGALLGLGVTLWICVGGLISRAQKLISYPKLPVSVDGCQFGNFTLAPPSELGTGDDASHESTGGLLELYRVSYIWYPAISWTLTVLMGVCLSYITGGQNVRQLNPKLISPLTNRVVRGLCSNKMLRRIGWDDIGLEFGAREKNTQEELPLKTRENRMGPSTI